MAIIERDGCKYADDETLRELSECRDEWVLIAPHGLVGDRSKP